VGVSVSLGNYDLAQSADLNFLPDHLTALIGHVQPNQVPGYRRNRDDYSQIVVDTDGLPMRTRHNFGPDSR
jgi:hypothetical protein